MSESSLLSRLLQECGDLFQPLESLADGEGVTTLLRALGYDFPIDTAFPIAFGSLVQSVQEIRTAVAALLNATSDSERTAKTMDLTLASLTLINSLKDLGSNMQTALSSFADFRDKSGIEQTFFNRLVDYLIFRYLGLNYPDIQNLAMLLGLMEWVHTDADPEHFQVECLRPKIYWDRFLLFFGKPLELADQAYAWQTAFDSDKFLARLFLVLSRLGFLGGTFPQDARIAAWLGRPANDQQEYRVPLFSDKTNGVFAEAGFKMSGAPAQGNEKAGLALFPYALGGANLQTELIEGLFLELASTLSLDNPISLVIRPPAKLVLHTDLFSTPTIPLNASFSLKLKRVVPAGGSLVLLGEMDSTHLSMADSSLGFLVRLQEAEAEFVFEIELKDLEFVLNAGEGDGFLKKVLPAGDLGAKLDLGLAYSSQSGFHLKSGNGLEVTLPLHVSLGGVLELDSLLFKIKLETEKLTGLVALTGGLQLGPLDATVEQIGLKIILEFTPNQTGNLGPVNFGLEFKPPNGLGLALDTGVVVGGGYLFFDPDNAKYAGVLQLWIAKKIAITAIGLLTTRMPDGSDGFSLLIILCVEFPPIQLGFGFTLNGLGGLLGVNRTMVLDALRAGVKNQTLNSILFPKDPIRNAAKIISDLSMIYPPAQDRFVFGPMAILGWGSPEPLLKIELGVVLEIPSPIRLAILGRITLALPNEKAAVVLIHLDILGAIDFDQGNASVDATLYDSRIVQFVLSGDMAMRLNWGANPIFLMAAGGFHPLFPPPPNFPTLNRLAISLATGDNPRIRLESYLATTSNTVQFGARLDLYVAINMKILGTFSASAYFSLDVLVQFKPFQFQADVTAGAAIKHNDDVLFSVQLNFSLSGPNPWHAWGEASFEFLGKHRIPFDCTLASDEPAPALPEPVDPLPELLAAVGDVRNWSAQLPAEGQMVVSLKKIDPGSDVLAHPFGILTLRQKVLPLDIEIRKFGSSPLAGPRTYSIVQVMLGTQDSYLTSPLTDAFAPGQYFELSQDEKMSRPAFEYMNSGYTDLGTAALRYDVGKKIRAEFDYETVLIDAKDKPGRPADSYSLVQELFEALAPLGAAGRAAIRDSGSERFAGPSQGIRVKEPEYVVASKKDLAAAPGQTSKTYTQAKIEQERLAQEDKSWQVVASHEARA